MTDSQKERAVYVLLTCCLLWCSNSVRADDPSLTSKLKGLFRRSAGERVKPGMAPEMAPTKGLPDRLEMSSGSGNPSQASAEGAAPRPLAATQEAASHGPILQISAVQPRSSLTLETLEQIARENNPTLAQAAAVIDMARGRQIQAGLYPNPSIGYIGSEIGNEGRSGQQGFLLEQEIVTSGKLRFAQAVAGCEREQAEAQAVAQMVRVMNSVRSLFYTTLAAERTRTLTQELVKLAEKAASVAQQREKAGEGTLTETLQAQIELEQVRILDKNASSALRAAWKRLAALVGMPPAEPVPLDEPHDPVHDERDEMKTLATITAQSPEIQIAMAGIHRAEAAVNRAIAQQLPNVKLEAGTQYDFATRDQIANVGISVPLPIFNRNEGNIVAAGAELLRSRRELDRVKLSLNQRFATVYAHYENAREQVERYGTRLPEDEVPRILSLMGEERQKALDAHPQILPRAQIALSLATEGWQRGEFNYLQVLTAQRTLAQVSLSYVRSLAELQQSIVAIDGYLLVEGMTESSSDSDVAPHPVTAAANE